MLIAAVVCVTSLVSARPNYSREHPIFPPKYITIVKESRTYPDTSNNGRFSSYFKASNGMEVSVDGHEDDDNGHVMTGTYK